MEYLSDPEVDFGHCSSKCVNYENPNLNIALPIFSIHGNHDDPSGHGGHSCLDLIHEAGMINYWGKVTDLKHIKVRPVLLRKGSVQVGVYCPAISQSMNNCTMISGGALWAFPCER